MKYLFLDNQIYIYLFERNDTKELRKLEYLLLNNTKIVISLETLIEFSQSDDLEQALQLTANALRLQPLWIDTFANIQKIELNHFIDKNYLKIHSCNKPIIHINFNNLFNNKSITPIDFVRGAFKYNKMNENSKKQHQNILEQLLKYKNNDLYNEEINSVTLNNKICKLLPQDKLNELKFTLEDKRALVKYCIDNKKNLYKNCPSIQCEHHIAKYRMSDKGRKPRLSDSKDYTISIATFPYVNYFITNDSFLYNGLKYVKKHIPKNNTNIHRSLGEIK